jgi:NAD(P)-dependent dehydrogenase (short-subunit alcohol dehydrogenase family)
MRTVLLTNATQYAGPGAVEILLQQGMRVICHDPGFQDQAARTAFQNLHAKAECLEQANPAGLVRELQERGIEIDALVSNDVYPITKSPITDVALDDLRNTFEAVVIFPVHLTQLLLPAMKARGSGCFVFITSARPLRPESGFAVPTSVRAAATTFALALSRDVAPDGIQVNVIAPNYLYSEMYYPRARFIDDPEGRRKIADTVPAGRLGTSQEIGELISFYASGRAPFVTGQVIYFTGGWP